MRNEIAALGGSPIFERPLQIVRPLFPDISKFLIPLKAALASGQVTNGGHWVLETACPILKPYILQCFVSNVLQIIPFVSQLGSRQVRPLQT